MQWQGRTDECQWLGILYHLTQVMVTEERLPKESESPQSNDALHVLWAGCSALGRHIHIHFSVLTGGEPRYC